MTNSNVLRHLAGGLLGNYFNTQFKGHILMRKIKHNSLSYVIECIIATKQQQHANPKRINMNMIIIYNK